MHRVSQKRHKITKNYSLKQKKIMKTFNFKKVNLIMRVVQTENDKFKFEVLYKDDLVFTNNKEYESTKDCITDLANYCEQLVNLNGYEILTVVL